MLFLITVPTPGYCSSLHAVAGASAQSTDNINDQYDNPPAQERYTTTTVANVESSASTRSAYSSAAAVADYGLLKVMASASSVTIDYRPGVDRVDWGVASASAGAAFQDTWTIDNKDLNGSTGTINFHFGVTGGVSGYQVGNPDTLSAKAEMRFNDDWYTRWYIGENGHFTAPAGGKSYSMEFTYGQPFTFGVSLSAGAGSSDRGVWTTSTADFSHTVGLDGIQLFYGSNEVTDYTLTALSGHEYTFNNTVVPEPVSTVLFITGGAALAAARLRRKK